MMYKTKYFERLAENELRNISDSLEKAIITESKKLNEWDHFTGDSFDIFLSHSYLDKKIIYGIYKELTKLGYQVYIDWIKDPELNRSNVTKRNAELIRQRLSESKCLLYATTTNSTDSKWMPWELGYMDGLNSRVAILPMIEDFEDEFKSVEYMRLYPYVEKAKIENSNDKILWVCENSKTYNTFDNWINGQELKLH